MAGRLISEVSLIGLCRNAVLLSSCPSTQRGDAASSKAAQPKSPPCPRYAASADVFFLGLLTAPAMAGAPRKCFPRPPLLKHSRTHVSSADQSPPFGSGVTALVTRNAASLPPWTPAPSVVGRHQLSSALYLTRPQLLTASPGYEGGCRPGQAAPIQGTRFCGCRLGLPCRLF